MDLRCGLKIENLASANHRYACLPKRAAKGEMLAFVGISPRDCTRRQNIRNRMTTASTSRDVILTTLYRGDFAVFAPFVHSLERTGYRGRKVMFVSQLKPDVLAESRAHGYELEPFTFIGRRIRHYLLIENLLPNVHVHPNGLGPVLTMAVMHPAGVQFNAAGEVLNADGQPAPVLHQYDRLIEANNRLLAGSEKSCANCRHSIA